MAGVRKLRDVKGSVFDLAHLVGMGDGGCSVLMVSDTTISMLALFARNEVNWLTRYAVEWRGTDGYIPPDEYSEEHYAMLDIARRFRLEISMSCEFSEFLARITASMEGIAAGSVGVGDTEPAGFTGSVPVGPGERWETSEAYLGDKCTVANGIYDTILNYVAWLADNRADILAGQFGGITTGLVVGLLAAGPAGWAVVLASSVLGSIAGLLLAYALSLSTLETALGEVQSECVLALYGAGSAVEAESAFLVALDGATTSISALERGLVQMLLTTNMLNQLFDPREDMLQYVPPSPIDCGSALSDVWSFAAGYESWTFVDESTGGASSSRSHSVPLGAIVVNNVIIASPYSTALGTNVSPLLSQAVVPGWSIGVDWGATSDGVISTVYIKAVYSDATFEQTGYTSKNAGTGSLVLTQSKTLDYIRVSIHRSNGSSSTPYNYTQAIYEVRLTEA